MFNDKGDSGDWGASRAATRKTRTCTSNRLYTIFSSINNRPKNIGYACLLINFMMIVRYSMFNVRYVSRCVASYLLRWTRAIELGIGVWHGMVWHGISQFGSSFPLFSCSLSIWVKWRINNLLFSQWVLKYTSLDAFIQIIDTVLCLSKLLEVNSCTMAHDTQTEQRTNECTKTKKNNDNENGNNKVTSHNIQATAAEFREWMKRRKTNAPNTPMTIKILEIWMWTVFGSRASNSL